MDFRKLAEEQKPSFLKDLNTIISINSVRDEATAGPGKPFGNGPKEALDAMLSMGKRDGFDVKNIDGYAGVVEYGDPDNPDTLGILGHLDIVPLGEGWTKQPLALTVNDGYLFGRGVLDDKGPTMAAYYALKLIREAKIPLKKRVMLVMGCDEESGMECMNYYLSHAEIPKTGFVPDADFPVIYGEKGGAHIILESETSTAIRSMHAGTRPNIVIGKADMTTDKATELQKELFAFFLKANSLEGSWKDNEDATTTWHVEGTPSHAAWPYKGVNAAVQLLRFAGAAFNDKLAHALGWLTSDWTGKNLGIQQDGLYMGMLTQNPGIVDIEKGKTSVLLDIRYPNETNGQELLEKIRKAADGTEAGIHAVLKSDSRPLFVDPDSTLVKTLMDVYRTHTGDVYSPAITIGGGTYARKFENFVSFGPELPNDVKTTDQFVGGPHQRDEGIRESDLINAIAIYADAILRLAA